MLNRPKFARQKDLRSWHAHYRPFKPSAPRSTPCSPKAATWSRSSTVKTTSGPITIARSKLRGTGEKFTSRLFGTGVTRTNALETLIIASFVRGLSVRDVERRGLRCALAMRQDRR
ncbi:hypothetical protein GCM10009555_062200 [Acrocarpospora macrocephala]|uniref:Mutator family transposase n=1 Tax=Acrocarpospora macrocephala TaxID=150177 RepID=A0A5M3WSG8_9ACTN|nr:hypothetical protein Amac_032590 [Acrocarpospora macrocephala]